jgi:iron complex transport system ATP-binding protein
MSSVELRGVTVALGGRPVLSGVSASVGSGDWVALVGPNGAGKSTLLRAVCGLQKYAGSIIVDRIDLSALGRRDVARRIALVPQTPTTPTELTVSEYIVLGRVPHSGYLAKPSRRDREAVTRTLERLDLSALRDRRLGSLSGGERQRAVLARALAQEAPLLLLDEPTTGLDIGRQQHVLELVESLRVEAALTVISAMHDLTLAGQYADRLLLLSHGQLIADGSAREVLTEAQIGAHYQASVRVLDERQNVVVVPLRNR